MATHIPTRGSCLARMTPGERRLSERLLQKLEDDYVIWYDVPIGLKQRHPDFVVFHPRRGLLILEVKDWKPETIHHADRTQFHLVTSRGLVTENNPLLQARACALEVGVVLERDPLLRHPAGHPHAGKLAMPWACGVVFTNINRARFDGGQLGELIPEHLVICQDEMLPSTDAEAFQERLWAMFPQVFPVALSLPQIDRIRWHLFPELRVEPGNGQFGLFDATGHDSHGVLSVPDIVKVMDAQQEQLARSMGSGHRVIHGVAGSGKTMILGFRATHLAQALHKPILVLCYNKTLAAWLEKLMATRGLGDKVQVYNFHRWCRRMLISYHAELPPDGTRGYFAQLVERVIHAVGRGQIPRFQYGAILIDEGHDFEPEWFKLIVQMVDPHTDSLLVLYDDAQNIYRRSARGTATWKSLGINAQGHTTILKLNYRNSVEVLSVARSFAQNLLVAREDDDIPLIAPESAGRHGPTPELARFGNVWHEQRALAQALDEEHARGRRWSEMAVIYRHHACGDGVARALAQCDIPCSSDTQRGKTQMFTTGDNVKLVTMHSCKGLEFPFVILPDLGAMPAPGDDESNEERLLYVAMTRATERLLMLHHSESEFTRRIRATINDVQTELATARA